MKRGLDIAISVLGLIIGSPIILITIGLVRLETPGPGIFRQIRLGRHRRTFTMYKVRTMRLGTGDAPSHKVGVNSVTDVGRVLRNLKLDELPQLWNVLRGDMSLVGPRPCLPSQSELIRERLERGVFEVRPGITGLAQIRGIDMSAPECLAAIDAEYIRDRTFAGDLKLIFRTLGGSGRGDAAPNGRLS